MQRVLITAVLFFNIIIAFAQSGTINGVLKFKNNAPATGVAVIISGLQRSAISDQNGNFRFENVAYGTYTLEFSSIDAHINFTEVIVNSPSVPVAATMERVSANQLSEVLVSTISAKKEIERKGFAVNVIETKEAGLRNIQTNELLDRTVGVRIRQNGGLGADVNYNLNGMSGNSVRIFIDGIPTTTYGSSFDLNSIPPGIIDRIEVYKGVVPGHLSDDALGGAINIVLKKGSINNFSASASYGSFNTSQLNFTGQYRVEKSGLTFKASGFYNYSDNDYEVWGSDVYNILPNGRRDYVRVKRFNDAFRSVGGIFDVGFTNVKWADQFFIGYNRSDAYKEVQHGTFMTIPYKGRFTESDAGLFHLTYNKKDIFTKGLEFNVHGIYGERNRVINDTVRHNYNWFGEQSLNLYGEPIIRPSGAQQGAPTIANIRREVGSVRAGLNYAINDNHRFMLNHVMSVVNREDDDEIRSVLERKFFGTRDLNKNVTSLSYELTAFENKLTTTVFGKTYNQKVERTNPVIVDIDGVPTRVDETLAKENSVSGYGFAASYAVLPTVTVSASAERGVRLPNENEIFGDAGDNITENFGINAETSNNYNLGVKLGAFNAGKHQMALSANGFSRNIKDRIGLIVQTLINNNVQTLPYVNQGNVKSRGFDLELSYNFNKNLNIILNTSKFSLYTTDGFGRDKDIPNEPMFSVNASAQYSLRDIIQKESNLNLFYNFHFVDTFNYMMFPYSNNGGLGGFEVDQQYVHDAGLSYAFPKKNFVVSFDAKNIFNKKVFDNYAVQKPGRAFYLKLNYVINNF